MMGFIEVTDKALKKEVLDYAVALDKDNDGDVVYYKDNIFYVHMQSGYVSIRTYDVDTSVKEEDKC